MFTFTFIQYILIVHVLIRITNRHTFHVNPVLDEYTVNAIAVDVVDEAVSTYTEIIMMGY